MKVVMTIAGSDSSGGAGIQADLKTFQSFGVFGTSVITVLTAQNTTGVFDIFPLTPDFVRKQAEIILEDFQVSAIKIGMLFNTQIIQEVTHLIKTLNIPVVLDPVAISKAGSKLLDDTAVDALRKMFDYVDIITPNQYEARLFFGESPDFESISKSIKASVLVKKNIIYEEENKKSVDVLYRNGQKREFSSPFIHTNNLHGTGCSFSSAIASCLAIGYSIEESISIAKEFIYYALLYAPQIGHGPGPLNHAKAGQLIKNKIMEVVV